jgi:hypothetical protein
MRTHAFVNYVAFLLIGICIGMQINRPVVNQPPLPPEYPSWQQMNPPTSEEFTPDMNGAREGYHKATPDMKETPKVIPQYDPPMVPRTRRTPVEPKGPDILA